MRLLVPLMFVVGCGGSEVSETPPPQDGAAPAPAPATEAVPVNMPELPEGQVVEVDGAASSFEWVGAKVTKEHPGGFTSYKGRVVLGAEDTVLGTEFVIDMDSTFSDSAKLTKHLKDPDFFDVPNFATARFVSSEIQVVNGVEHRVKGTLDFHGNTRSIEFPAQISVEETAVGVVADFPLNRQDFGVSYAGKPDNLIKDIVQIKLNLKFPR